MLVFDRLIEWLTYFKRLLPDYYYWTYTNGLAVDENKLKILAQSGLDEIRFNVAATDYNNPEILSKIERATQLIKNVAVEIPSIPDDYGKVINILPVLDRLKVKYLNLHEYILMPDDPNSMTTIAGTFLLNYETKLKYHPYSLQNTEKIKQFSEKKRLNICINNCSLQKKEYQMLQRRITMARMVKKNYECVSPQGFLQSYIIHPKISSLNELRHIIDKGSFSDLEKYCIHPDALKDDADLSNGTVVSLTFLPPMEIAGKRKLYQMKAFQADASDGFMESAGSTTRFT